MYNQTICRREQEEAKQQHRHREEEEEEGHADQTTPPSSFLPPSSPVLSPVSPLDPPRSGIITICFPPPRLSLDPTTMFFFSPRRGVFPCLVASRNFCKNSGPFSLPAAGGKRKTGHAPRKKNRPRSSPSGHVAWLLAWSGYTVPAPACETDKEGCVSVWLFGDIQERRHVKEEKSDGGYS